MVSLKELYDLQEIDSAIWEREQALGKIIAELEDDAGIRASKSRLERYEAQLDEQGAVRSNMEFAVQQIQEKLKNVEERLFGGSITNPRELTAYQDERGLLRGQLSEEEDKLLEQMVTIEDLQGTRNQARQHLETLESAVGARRAELSKEKERLEGELSELGQERSSAIALVAPATLPLYQSLLKSRNGVAVSKVERSRGMCQACRVTLPSSDLQRARSSESIVQCSNCRRILYVV